MTSVTFRKTLLALAVSSAGLPAHAATWQLNDSGLAIGEETFTEEIDIVGSYSGSGSALTLSSTTLGNGLILNATIDSQGEGAVGLDMESHDRYSFVDEVPVEVGGDLINKGSITVTGNGSSAMMLDPAHVKGSVINEGTLRATGGIFTEEDGYWEAARGLDIALTAVDGDVHNKGAITVDGEKAKGIWMSSEAEAVAERRTQIGGSLINSGTIRATDSVSEGFSGWDYPDDDPVFPGRVLISAAGIHLEDVTVGQDIVNDTGGMIEVSGEQSVGILLEGTEVKGKLINLGAIKVSGKRSGAIDTTSLNDQDVKLERIENHGSIIAEGEESEGMVLSFASTDPKVINTGTIEADGTAIWLEGFGEVEVDNFLEIEHRGGLISGGVTAIDAQRGGVDLLWSGGRIEGDILLGAGDPEVDDGVVVVSGNVEFDGDTIQAYGMDVGSNPEYDTASYDGHLELERPHTDIIGSLWVGSGSALGMNLSDATDSSKAILSVSNRAVFAKGAQIKLDAKGSDFSAEGTTYTLVKAASIDNGAANDNLEVSSRSALLNVDTVEVDDTQVMATVTARSPGQVAASARQHGASRNAQSAIRGFTPIMGRLAENDPVFVAFSHANESEMAKLAEQLSPEANGGSQTAATTGQTLINNVTSSRTSSARQGLSSGEAFQETGVWAQALYSDANQDLRDGIAGYNAYSRGIAIGADSKLNKQLTLGLAYSFLNTDVNSETGNTTEVDGHAFTLYSGYELGNYFLDSSLTYGFNDNESERHIAGTSATADYESDLLGLNLMGGYSFHMEHGLLIEPRVAARYSNVQIDGYRESGSSAALRVEDQRYEVAELGAGVRFAGSFDVGQGTLEPQAKLMGYHDFAADRASTTSSFVMGGTPFITHGADPVRNSYEAGIGVDYRLGATTLGASYDYVGKTDFSADTFVAKVRYDF